MGGRVPQDYENKDLIPSATFLINRTQLESKNHLFLTLQISTAYQKNEIDTFFIKRLQLFPCLVLIQSTQFSQW